MQSIKCPHCQNDDSSLLEPISLMIWFCTVCARPFQIDDGEPNDPITNRQKDRKTTDEKV